MTQRNITFARGGISLLLLVIAVVLFLLAAFGIGAKWDINLVDLGLAFGFGSFIFG
jgi:hypothetical protein